MKKNNKSLLSNPGFQTLLASLVCIVVGLLAGYIVLLIINPAKATEGIVTILKNFLTYGSGKAAMKYFGKCAPSPCSSATPQACSISAQPDSMSPAQVSAFTQRLY